MSDSVQPHRQQPTRLPRSWDSPGKNTGVGCHFLLQSRTVKSESEVTQSCLSDPMDSWRPHGLLATPWTAAYQAPSIHGIFQARVLEWIAIAFSSFVLEYSQLTGFPGGVSDKEPTCQCRIPKRWGFGPWLRKIPWRRAWQVTPVFLPGKPHGQKPGGLWSTGL